MDITLKRMEILSIRSSGKCAISVSTPFTRARTAIEFSQGSIWRSLALRLRHKGKPGSVVAVAIANRWVRKLYHEMKELRAPKEVTAAA